MPPGVKKTRDIFISESNKKHNNAYTYDNVVYVNNLTKVLITCPIHKDFEQLPECHLRGHGCRDCSFISTANKKILTSKSNFFTKIKIVDNENRWDYTEVDKEYRGIDSVVTLKCNGCGHKTRRTPYKHLHDFPPCKRHCFIVKPRLFDLKDVVADEPLDNEPLDNIITTEVWRPFSKNKNYLVSSKGIIRNLKTNKVFTGSLDATSGYMRTAILGKMYSIHFMVASTFLSNPDEKPTINHKNKIRTDNRVENLEWSTYLEQNIHKSKVLIKTYKSHKNGKTVLRINKDTNKTIESYPTLMLAAKWILENVYNQDTNSKDIQKELSNMSNSLSQGIRRNNNNYFHDNFIWKFEDEKKTKKNEIWELVEGMYYISNLGRWKSGSKIKEVFSITGGYYDIKIDNKHHKIHRLVAGHFVDNPHKKPFVNHKNGDKLDNRAENLEWVTNKENIIHAYENGLIKKGVTPVIQCNAEGEVVKRFESISKASKELNIHSSGISACCRGIILQTRGYHFKYVK